MGNFFNSDAAEEEQEEVEALQRWRPASEQQMFGALKRKKMSSKSSESSEEGSGGGQSESASVTSSASKMESESSDGEGGSEKGGDDEKGSQGSKEDAGESSEGSDLEDAEAEERAKKDDAKRKKKPIVRMEFEPLLSLHEPLATVMEEPADLFAKGKRKRKHERAERAAIEDAAAQFREKAKMAAEWMLDMGYEECPLNEVAQAVAESPDELRYCLEQSHRFTVDNDDVVKQTLLQRVLNIMESDIETMGEVMDKLGEDEEEGVRDAVKSSLGELRIEVANDIPLIKHVDIEVEQRMKREEEKELRLKEKTEKQKARNKRSKKMQNIQEDDSDDSSSDEEGEEGTGDATVSVNKEAERKALAFRRVQVQRKIEDFLKLYTRGQNLQKINAKGKRYHRHVYVDTTKRALVVQGASGPKFFPFVSMKEVDIDTRTTKEGRVETHVICAMEKGGRIYKELNLAFPDQAKANHFVNCVTLFSSALRHAPKR